MDKFKICPRCKTSNHPAEIECTNCGFDLTSIRPVDKPGCLENKKAEPIPTNQQLFRHCECGAQNPPQARKCNECGEDISDIQPTITVEQNNGFLLKSLDGKYVFNMDNPYCIVGREASMQEYLKDKKYVSRKHAKLALINDGLTVENLSNTNFTYVNNVLIEKVKILNDGDELALGGLSVNGERQNQAAYFVVKKSL